MKNSGISYLTSQAVGLDVLLSALSSGNTEVSFIFLLLK
jgi:hypothetical protein